MLRRWLYALLTGFTWAYYSEWMFWFGLPVKLNAVEITFTWLMYSLATYCVLILITHFRVRNVWSLFLAGALYGWLIEGVIVQTMYDNFPLHISWTGLGWHALISVVCGWHYLHQRQLSGHWWQTLVGSIGFGVFFGVQANGWWADGETVASPDFVAFYATLFTCLLVIVTFLLRLIGKVDLKPTRLEALFLIGVMSAYIVFVTIPTVPFAALILPMVFIPTILSLQRNKMQEAETVSPVMKSKPASILLLFAIPVVASILYWAGYSSNFPVEGFTIIGITLIPGGFLMYGVSLYKIWHRPTLRHLQ